jgi:hypothetical protein
MRIVGIVLLVLGLAGLAVGTFQYTRQRKVVDAGPVHISHTATETVTVPPLAAGGVATIGLLLTLAGSRRR